MPAARPAILGGFVLGGMALVAAGILFFGGTRLFERNVRAVVFFEGSVAGLDTGAPVTFRGVRIGSVQRVALVVAADGATVRIPVYLELDPGRVEFEGGAAPAGRGGADEGKRWAEAGVRAQLASQSFVTGQMRVDLDLRPGTPLTLVGGAAGVDEIPALPSDLDKLRSTLAEVPVQDVMRTVQRTLATVDRLAARLDGEFGPLAENARGAAEAATRTLQTADETLRGLRDGASAALGGLEAMVAEGREQLGARGADLQRTLAAADRVARQAETLLVAVNGLAAPRAQFRGDLEAAARDLSAGAGSLRAFARSVERNPSSLLTGRTGQ